MAWTRVEVIRYPIRNTIKYVLNKDKTALIQKLYEGDDPEINKVFADTKLTHSIDYALNRDKTETTLFESALYCSRNTAYQDFMATKIRYGKLDKVQGYHLVQSFKGQEASPELAHKIGMELAKRLLGEGFQAVISTHLNTNNIHNHIVWNAVNWQDGSKYVSNERSYYTQVRRISDELCRKYGLSIIEPKEGSRSKSRAEYYAEQRGEPTQKGILKKAIDAAIRKSFTYAQFLSVMEEQGYLFKLDRKRPSIGRRDWERYHRFDRLGDGYDIEEIKERIVSQSLQSYQAQWEPRNDKPQRPPRKHSVFHRTTLRSAFSLKGLRGLYFHYLYRMGMLPKKNEAPVRKISPMLQEEIRQLDKRIRMYKYLKDHGIETMLQLHARRDAVQNEIDPLLAERKRLYKKPDGKEKVVEVNQRLKPLWAEVYLCRDIEAHSLKISRKLRAADELERDIVQSRKQHTAPSRRKQIE